MSLIPDRHEPSNPIAISEAELLVRMSFSTSYLKSTTAARDACDKLFRRSVATVSLLTCPFNNRFDWGEQTERHGDSPVISTNQ